MAGRIEQDKIDLGHGKRVLVSGGTLDPVLLITIPKEVANEDCFALRWHRDQSVHPRYAAPFGRY